MYKNINKKINLKLKTKLLKQDLYEIDSNFSQTVIITINNSNHLNAINNEILDNLIEVFSYYIQNQSVRTIILTGAGEKSFIAGADIKAMSKFTPNQAYDYSIKGHELISIMLSSTKPIIAAVNGFALGGGCEIASACHFRYSSPNAIFGQPEVKLGIIAGWGGTQNLPKIVGIAHALEMLVTGKTISAQDAYRIGLVNGVFENDLIENVLKISKTINENSPNAISNTLSSINKSLNLDIFDGLKIEANLFKDSFKNNESKNGLNSFVKKEKPKF